MRKLLYQIIAELREIKKVLAGIYTLLGYIWDEARISNGVPRFRYFEEDDE